MSVQIQARRDSSEVPLTLSVTKDGGVAGLTVKVAIRDGATDDSYLDFADDTFKTSGHTTREATLTDISGGFYALTGGLDVSAITNLPAATFLLVAEYEVSGAEQGVANDVIVLTQTEENIEFLVSTFLHRLRVNIDTQKLELFNLAGTAIIQSWPLTTKGGELVSTQFGVQVERGVPEL